MQPNYEDIACFLYDLPRERHQVICLHDVDDRVISSGLLHGCMTVTQSLDSMEATRSVFAAIKRLRQIVPTRSLSIFQMTVQELIVMLPPAELRDAENSFNGLVPPGFRWTWKLKK